jgi:hypothetical protein
LRGHHVALEHVNVVLYSFDFRLQVRAVLLQRLNPTLQLPACVQTVLMDIFPCLAQGSQHPRAMQPSKVVL